MLKIIQFRDTFQHTISDSIDSDCVQKFGTVVMLVIIYPSKAQVKVRLRLAVYRLGAEPLETHDRRFFLLN
jgi:hypothetical protein